MTNTNETRKMVPIRLKGTALKGNLVIPKKAWGIVIFSNGNGSRRLSPRNKFVAAELQKKGLATLLVNLLTEDEDIFYDNGFNIDLLTLRLIDITQWVQQEQVTKNLPIGYFGASTGAASALRAAAFYGKDIKAVVSRGGRPDMALQELHKVTAPTLLIVGGWDHVIIELNEIAFKKLPDNKKLEIVPETGHLFEEFGKLEEVARISAAWFVKWL